MSCEKVKNSVIPIFMVCDSEYVPFAMTAILSILHHTERKLVFHFIHDGSVTKGEQKQCQQLIRQFEHAEIQFSVWGNREHFTTWTDRFPPLVFVRLLLPEMFPQYDRGIFLDADILVERDIGELFDTDMKGKLIGAVPEKNWRVNYDKNEPLGNAFGKMGTADYYKSLGFDPDQEYCYSGVLLLDMLGLRKCRLAEIISSHKNDRLLFPEQDLLNVYLHQWITTLDSCWNYVIRPKELPMYQISHYVNKPWRNSSVNLPEKRYWSALRDTPWFYRGRAELLLYEIEASINSNWRYPGDSVIKALFKLGGCFLAALFRRMKKRYS